MDPVVFRLRAFLAVMAGVTVLGTLGFMVVEDLSLVDAVYFSLVTITTVGYGDIHPSGSAGKFLAIILIVGGVGTFTGVVANATELLLTRREKERRKQKLNMVIGLFFSELGIGLLARFAEIDDGLESHRRNFKIDEASSDASLMEAAGKAKDYDFAVSAEKADLPLLREFLNEQGTLLLRLLEHPALLENETFSDLLRAVFHLREELMHRKHLDHPSPADLKHLGVDMVRVYKLLVHQWLEYVRHLKVHYPYLYLLAVRRNPFMGEKGVDL